MYVCVYSMIYACRGFASSVYPCARRQAWPRVYVCRYACMHLCLYSCVCIQCRHVIYGWMDVRYDYEYARFTSRALTLARRQAWPRVGPMAGSIRTMAGSIRTMARNIRFRLGVTLGGRYMLRQTSVWTGAVWPRDVGGG